MTIDKCIEILKLENELILFNPSTGETLFPNMLNDINKECYDAHEFLINYLENL